MRAAAGAWAAKRAGAQVGCMWQQGQGKAHLSTLLNVQVLVGAAAAQPTNQCTAHVTHHVNV